MRPLLWTNRSVQLLAAITVGWLLSIELGTSRRASRQAAGSDADGERVVDTITGTTFDLAAAVAVGCGLASSAGARSTIPARRTASFGGLTLLVAAGSLSRVARAHLGRFHRDALTVHPDHELIDTGPYGYVRHPLYTATLGALVGLGLVLGTWISLGMTTLPIAAVLRRITVEEAMLGDALGETYAEYRERTSRLVPGVY